MRRPLPHAIMGNENSGLPGGPGQEKGWTWNRQIIFWEGSGRTIILSVRARSGWPTILQKIMTRRCFLTAARLGKEVGVSESTTVRFATQLGYKGFPEFHRALEELVRNRLNSIQRMEVTVRACAPGGDSGSDLSVGY